MLDGAMGTMLQRHQLSEEDFRGERFADHPKDLRGNNDLLSLTQPDIVRDIHRAYFAAGADIVTTNTFTSTRIAQTDYGLAHIAGELNEAAGTAGARGGRRGGGRRRAAALRRRVAGPTNRTARSRPTSTTPRPATSRSRSWPRRTRRRPRARRAAARTSCSSRPCSTRSTPRARSSASRRRSTRSGYRLPVVVSGTIVDASGRTLSGQTVEGFWAAIRHARPLLVGLNCALGAKQLREHVEELGGSPTCRSPPTRTPACQTSSAATTRRPR